MPPSYGGPQLPRDLLDKIGGARFIFHEDLLIADTLPGGPKRKDNNSTRGGRRNLPTTRKDQRKQDRVQKRYARNGAVQKPSRSTPARSNSGGWPVKALVSDDDLGEDDLDDSVKTTQPTANAAPVLKSALKASTKAAPIPVPPAPAKSTSASQLQPSKANKQPPTSRVSKAMQEKLARDDAEIAALEKKLGMKGGKGLGKSFEDEGLAELLGDLEGTDDTIGSKSKRKSSADREWLQSKRRKIAPGVQEEEQDDEDSEDDDADSFGENDDETRPEDDASAESDGEEGDLMEFDDGDIVDIDLDAEPPSDDSEDLEDDDNGSDEDDIERDDMQEDLGNEVVEDKDDELEDDDDLGFASEDEKDGVEEGAPKRAREVDDDEDLGLDSDDAEEAPPKRARENPYIAPGTTGDKPSGKYIPPSLRAPTTSDAELAGRLKRQVQGLLNRLSEANIISILGEVELLYQNSPRQYVTSTLIDLLLGLICDRSTLNDTFLILHAGFIAAVYKVIGPDFGAQMIERVVEGFDRYYTKEENDEAGRKECTNLMSLLAQLYNLQVIGSELIFEYIRSFLDSLTELHTELLLRVVRSKHLPRFSTLHKRLTGSSIRLPTSSR
jgi:nucleolar MIF4G domain-containing protein 1